VNGDVAPEVSLVTLRRLSETRRHYGTAAAVRWLTARGLEKALRLEVNSLVCLDRKRRANAVALPALRPTFACRFVTPAEIASFGADPAYDLSPSLAARPTAGLDYCFGIFEGERLAAYSWYALRSVEGRHHVGVAMSFPADMAYMYKAFTHPDYRGNALYGIGVTKALDALEPRGITRLLSSIERVNFASRNACRRMGFEHLGYVRTLGRSDARIAWVPRAARQLGIEFGRRATVADRSVAAGRAALGDGAQRLRQWR